MFVWSSPKLPAENPPDCAYKCCWLYTSSSARCYALSLSAEDAACFSSFWNLVFKQFWLPTPHHDSTRRPSSQRVYNFWRKTLLLLLLINYVKTASTSRWLNHLRTDFFFYLEEGGWASRENSFPFHSVCALFILENK